jgi:hypothetical protein
MNKAPKAKARRNSSPPLSAVVPAPKKSNLHLHRAMRPDDGHAFLPDFGEGPMFTTDQMAETLAEEFLSSATSAEESGEDYRDAVFPEEYGGPFVVATAREEIANDEDPANPIGATREPFPTAVRVPPR